MRIVVYGAGGVGGVIGGRLFQHRDAHGHDVTLVSRGAHYEAIRSSGLTLNDPDGSVTLRVPVVDKINAVPLAGGDVVILTMKTQDSEAALEALAGHAPAGVAVACAQNGVENERLAARRFAAVHAICVMLPAQLLEPGVVDAAGSPHNAILDIGCYPEGVDDVARSLAATFEASGLASRPDPGIMRSKYTKLLMNLQNPLDALVDDRASWKDLYARARAEAEACLAAAGIEFVSDEEEQARRRGVMEIRPVPGRTRGGGSTWQTLMRGGRTTEVDWLNGEIVLLGHLHGVPTPVNTMLQSVARRAALDGRPARSFTAAELDALL
jgi:2-dehydropantoate 2-reductase